VDRSRSLTDGLLRIPSDLPALQVRLWRVAAACLRAFAAASVRLALAASFLLTITACRSQGSTPDVPESSRPKAQRRVDEPKGFRFSDGWLLEWKTSEASLTKHYRKRNDVTCDGNDCEVTLAFDIIPDSFIHLDLADSEHAWCTVRLHYFHDQFYEADAHVPLEKFDALEASLMAALGEPDSRRPSTVENAMGAKFDQIEDSWRVGDVKVHLSKRDDTVDRGKYTVTYSPIEQLIPPEPLPKAPF
jgi:hypothetical protein